jgi:uncharacterized protein (TIGR02145 family)
MNRFHKYFTLILLGLQFIFNSCKTDEVKLLPILSTLQITNISEATAYCGGEITNNGGYDIIARGVCISKLTEPTIKDTITSDSLGTGTFVSHITKLSPNTLYYVRAYATNKNGTAYGDIKSFSTNQLSLTTDSVSTISVNSAICSASIKTNGSAINVIERGVCWNTQPTPTIQNYRILSGNGSGNFSCNLANLSLFTTYYIRMYVINSSGIYYGNEISFKTKNGVAILNTNKPLSVSSNTMSLSATISSDGGSEITENGFCWSKSVNPTTSDYKLSIGKGIGSIFTSLPNLLPNTKYYICSYAKNDVSTTYSIPIIVTTNNIITDADGNSYNTVTIGTQTWMVENLRTTKFSDGTAIPLVTDTYSWISLNSPAYCWYNNDETSNKDKYGALYNGYAVQTGRLAPRGWHVPSEEEWITLKDFVSKNIGQSISVSKALASNSQWTNFDIANSYTKNYVGYNQTINNSSGFSALPGGIRKMLYNTRVFDSLGDTGIWWATTKYNSYSMRVFLLNYYSDTIEGSYDEYQGQHSYELINGLSVRCLKD